MEPKAYAKFQADFEISFQRDLERRFPSNSHQITSPPPIKRFRLSFEPTQPSELGIHSTLPKNDTTTLSKARKCVIIHNTEYLKRATKEEQGLSEE